MRRVLSFLIIGLCAVSVGFAQAGLSPAQKAKIDEAVAGVLADSGAPSASIAVVWDGAIAYEHAYGNATLTPPVRATTGMRYSIGSVSKQFTAAAILLLAEEKRISLDDKVSRWLPELTRAGEVSIRQLLSMTAGYQDYWPQDYVFQAMQTPTTAQHILDLWARKPLDFDPGTKWQYSNTNYVIAGLIAERVAGMPLFEFLRIRIFSLLGMASVKDVNVAPLGKEDAMRYLRNALGPCRVAPKEAAGWLFAAGELAMTAHDLAVWDISMIRQTLLKPASYREMQTQVRLNSGVGVGYGLGLDVAMAGDRRLLSHGGAVSGFLTQNSIYPDDGAAIVAFCNIYPGAAGPTTDITGRIARIIFEKEDAEMARELEQAKSIFAALQRGTIDRSLLSANASAYFSQEVLGDFASSLRSLGTPTEFVQTAANLRGGMTFRGYRIRAGDRLLKLTVRILGDGKIEQYLIEQGG